MVAPSVPRLGFEPQVCLARPILVHALDCYERGDYLGAGVRLRESVSRFLIAAVEWYAIELPARVKRSKHPKPAHLAKALRDAKVLDRWGFESILDCINVGNAAAHCQPLDVNLLRGTIAVLFAQIDSEPYSAMKDRQPIVAQFEDADYDVDDCDDDDRRKADWWKPEGWNPGGDV